jgi:hypothetical protein
MVQSSLIPASRTAVPHFTFSVLMNSAKSLAEPPSGVLPSSASFAFISGLPSALFASAFSCR